MQEEFPGEGEFDVIILVLGGPAYLGAKKVADDMDLKKWWKPTVEMERYMKSYLE